ncbi:hypothetical protein [Sphingomonas sp. RB1R13]|uniref:hypothetical protein n=1 Tax=Sphingomonas sp. RB1R13 TaxID=3096159 RepID=UPI002FC882F1
MKAGISVHALKDDAQWAAFVSSLNGVPNLLLQNLADRLRAAGAISALWEGAYIDRDFSAAYSAFYSTLFRPYRKFCSRVHFFASDVAPILALANVSEVVAGIEAVAKTYLGDIVLRPLAHAPVSSAHLAAVALAGDPVQEVSVRSVFKIHLLGVELKVDAMPLTQQDTRTGACAQATMWMAGRHFHNRHSAPWFSMPDITEIALNPTDSGITRSLPAGSEYLTQDNMVRALRAMGRHPVMYAPDEIVAGALVWQNVRPKDIVARYVDSGIPVLLGVQSAGTAIGHGLVAVGSERDAAKDLSTIAAGSTTAEFLTHFLVNDDQRGAYNRLPISATQKTGNDPFCLETDIKFILVPLPEKVFMTGETAELIAKDMMGQVAASRQVLADQALGAGSGWDVEPGTYAAVAAGTLVTRTYLTFGWKYKARTLRNGVSEHLKKELLMTQLPRYVWVTEFSQPTEASDVDTCKRLVRGHVVVDATGSRFWDSTLIIDAPGLSVLWHFDPVTPSSPPSLIVNADMVSTPYWPKIRGDLEYASCKVT